MSSLGYNFKDTNFLVKSAAIAALYAIITLMFPSLAYGPIQLRFSEILVLLVFYNKRFIPGLLLGYCCVWCDFWNFRIFFGFYDDY